MVCVLSYITIRFSFSKVSIKNARFQCFFLKYKKKATPIFNIFADIINFLLLFFHVIMNFISLYFMLHAFFRPHSLVFPPFFVLTLVFFYSFMNYYYVAIVIAISGRKIIIYVWNFYFCKICTFSAFHLQKYFFETSLYEAYLKPLQQSNPIVAIHYRISNKDKNKIPDISEFN